MTSPDSRPRLAYFATGGTIASVPGEATAGAAPRLSADALAAAVPGIAARAALHCVQFRQVPSPELTFADVLDLRAAIAAEIEGGAQGAVVTQGTDTLEETAFAFDLLWQGDAPVVFTGAMRHPSLPGSDGPANLLAAVQVALAPEARGCGALVVFNDEIHAARFVRKTHTASPSTFQSPALGPIGWVSEGRPVIALRPAQRPHVPVAAGTRVPPVALWTAALDDDGRLLRQAAPLGYRGLVVAALGGGHMRRETVGLLTELVAQMPVVLASRTGAGAVLSQTYDFPGSESDLLSLGLIRAGALDGPKARVLLALCLAANMPLASIRERFAAL